MTTNTIVLCIVAFLITPFTLFPSLTGDSVFENYLPIEQPTILEELQNILSKYPDGAQILRVSSHSIVTTLNQWLFNNATNMNNQRTTNYLWYKKKTTYDICRRKIQVLSRDRHIDMAGLNQFGIPNPPLAKRISNGRFVSTQKDAHFHTIEQRKHGQYNGRICWLLAKRVELHFLHIYYQLVINI